MAIHGTEVVMREVLGKWLFIVYTLPNIRLFHRKWPDDSAGSNSFSIHNAQKIIDYCFCSGLNQTAPQLKPLKILAFHLEKTTKTFNLDLET